MRNRLENELSELSVAFIEFHRALEKLEDSEIRKVIVTTLCGTILNTLQEIAKIMNDETLD